MKKKELLARLSEMRYRCGEYDIATLDAAINAVRYIDNKAFKND